jgi:hypothetical protein
MDGRMMIKCMFKKCDGENGLEQVAGCSEHGDQHVGYITCREFLD